MYDFYAKSNKVETIHEHTNLLLKNYEKIRSIYKDKIPEDIMTEDLWELLRLACQYHDVGKANPFFQQKISKNSNETLHLYPEMLVSIVPEREINHNYISAIMLDYKEILKGFNVNAKQKRYYQRILMLAIAFHHERDKEFSPEELINFFNNYILPNKTLLETHLNIKIAETLIPKEINGIMRRIITIDTSCIVENVDILQYILLIGFLRRIDQAASAHCEIEYEPTESITLKTLKFLEKNWELNELQQFTRKNKDKNLIIKAQTGSGKTEAALLWLNDRKGFFLLPTKATLNSIEERIFNELNYKEVGIKHSSSYNYLENKIYTSNSTQPKESFNSELYKYYSRSKNFAQPLMLTTIDQVLKFAFLYRSFENEMSLFAGNALILDEIQAYNPEIVAMILKAIEYIDRIGGHFMIMTATLPQFYIDELTNRGYIDESKLIIEDEPFLLKDKLTRHFLKVKETGILEQCDEIIEKAKTQQVLVICNTVKKAIEMYKTLSLAYDNCYLLHSRFKQKDKNRLEKEIKAFNKSKMPGIWITTQIVEASLNVDFDCLYTELSTFDSLSQRFGRCFRLRTEVPTEPNVFVCIEDASGIGTVYNKEIVKLSKIELLKHDNKLISEMDKDQIINTIYSTKALKHTDYYRQFMDALKYLDELDIANMQKNEAQQMVRNISSLNLMDFESYERIKDKLDKFQQLDDQGKKELYKLIEAETISVDARVVEKKSIIYETNTEFYFNILKKGVLYDDNIGLDVDQDIETILIT